MNYYPFHVGDYTAHTAHLTWEEDAAYRRMLDWYYLNEKALPTDPLKVARLVRMPQSLAIIESVLAEFFVQSDDGWHNKRADSELASMLSKQEQQSSKDAHEADRMRRHRERRAELFAALRSVGVVPAWDIAMKDLQRLHDENCNAPATEPATHLQREQVPNCNAPATAIPTPTPTPININAGVLSPQAAQPAARGSRLSADWVLPDDWAVWAKGERPDLDPLAVSAQFRDHWVAKPGKDGRKADWLATWRNWVRAQRVAVVHGGQATAKKALNRNSDEYAEAHKSASWWREAGFPSVWAAIASRCWHDNADQFHDGQRVEVAA